MKTAREIIQNLITDFIAFQDKVTYFGKDASGRGIFTAIGNIISEIWNDLYQAKRRLFTELSRGDDLDQAALRKGLKRKGATKSSAVLLFNGPAGTVIPKDTVIKSSISGVSYKTISDLTLGESNALLERPVNSNLLGDCVIAESITEGSGSKVGANELNIFETPVEGVTVSNLFPSVGGQDNETDEQLRYRLFNQVDILAQGTQAFYDSLARKANSDVLRTLVKYNSLAGGIDIYLVKNNGGIFSQEDLDLISENIYKNQRAMHPVLAKNNSFKTAEIEAVIQRYANYSLELIFTETASKLAELFDFSKLQFGSKIKYSDVVKVFLDSKYFEVPDLTSIKINGTNADLIANSFQLLKIISLKLSDGSSAKQSTLEQKYVVEY